MKSSAAHAQLLSRLEHRFRWRTVALYDTSVAAAEVDAAIRPFPADDVRFVDPWQTAPG